jgi:hypothetical protein
VRRVARRKKLLIIKTKEKGNSDYIGSNAGASRVCKGRRFVIGLHSIGDDLYLGDQRDVSRKRFPESRSEILSRIESFWVVANVKGSNRLQDKIDGLNTIERFRLRRFEVKTYVLDSIFDESARRIFIVELGDYSEPDEK